MLDSYVKELVYEGFTIVPPHIHNISTTLMELAGEASIHLINLLADLDCTVNFTREGEDDPDVGLIHRLPEEGKDIKYYLHTAHDFRSFVERSSLLQRYLPSPCKEIGLLNGLYQRLNHLVLRVLRDSNLDQMFDRPTHEIIDLYRRSFSRSIPHGTTTLRGLWYPAKENHRGARGHIDKSLVTVHLGDHGGNLFGHPKGRVEQPFRISPDAGCILLFWGVKAPMLSGGRLKPMWHSASTKVKEDRTAHVLFGHVETMPPVLDAKVALAEFCEAVGIEDPRLCLA